MVEACDYTAIISPVTLEFTIDIGCRVKPTCEASVFDLSAASEVYDGQVTDLDPLEFEFSAVEDSGSQTLLTTPGYEHLNCGQFKYTQMTLETMVVSASDLKYSV